MSENIKNSPVEWLQGIHISEIMNYTLNLEEDFLVLTRVAFWLKRYGHIKAPGRHMYFVNTRRLFSGNRPNLGYVVHLRGDLNLFYANMWVLDHALSIEKCEELNLISEEQADFLLALIKSDSDEEVNMAATLIEQSEFLARFIEHLRTET